MSRVLGLIAGVWAGCCIDKNALIALTFDHDLSDDSNDRDYNDHDSDYNENDAADEMRCRFSPLARSQSLRGFFLSPLACRLTIRTNSKQSFKESNFEI